MGRPSRRQQRRRDILRAFARVLAEHGYVGSTIAAIAAEAEISPGLVHHHFTNKAELLEALLSDLVDTFRRRVRDYDDGDDALLAYGDAAIRLDASADTIAARCWVGLFAEAIRNPTLFRRVRRILDGEIVTIQRRSNGALSTQEAGAIMAFVVGSLVVGAFAPRKTTGFAAPGLRQLLSGIRDSR